VCKIAVKNLHALLKYEQKLKGLFFDSWCISSFQVIRQRHCKASISALVAFLTDNFKVSFQALRDERVNCKQSVSTKTTNSN